MKCYKIKLEEFDFTTWLKSNKISLCRLAKISGVDLASLSNIKNGKRILTVKMFDRLSKALNDRKK